MLQLPPYDLLGRSLGPDTAALEIHLRLPSVAAPVSRLSTAPQRWRGTAAKSPALSGPAGLLGYLHLPPTQHLWCLALCLGTRRLALHPLDNSGKCLEFQLARGNGSQRGVTVPKPCPGVEGFGPHIPFSVTSEGQCTIVTRARLPGFRMLALPPST